MNCFRNFGITIFAFSLLLSISSAAFSITNYSVSPQQVEPGEYGTVNLIVTNLDTSNSAEGIKIEIRKTGYITMLNEISVGDLSPSASLTLSIPFSVDSNAPTGIYSFNIDIYGQSVSSTGSMQSLHKKVIASIKIVNPPALQLSLDNNEISDISRRVITVGNKGGAAKKVYLRVSSEEFGFLDRDVVYVENVDKNISVPVVIDARNANEGSQKIDFDITYEDSLGNEYSDARSLPITVRKESGDFVFIQKEPVVTGQESILKMDIKNEGNDIQNLRFSVADGAQLVGISEFKIGDLKKGDVKSIEVPILANIEPGSRTVKLNLKWIEQNENREGSKNVPLKVGSDADVGVYLEAKPTPLIANGEHTISITVSNLGSYAIEATTVEFSSDAFYMLSIQPEQYIGGLNEDDFSSVQYNIKVKDVDEDSYPVNIKVKYRDASGEWREKNIKRYVSIAKETEKGLANADLLLIAAVVIIGIAYWWFRRSRGKEK